MKQILSTILWDVSPEIINLFDSISIRWYGLLFACAFLVGQAIMTKIFETEKKPKEYIDSLTLYVVIGTVIGARLGHCLFYDFSYYSSHPLEILQVWKGGLASHGGGIGVLIATYLYAKKHADINYIWLIDRLVIIVAIAGAFIRMGNLMNSEIIGKPTDKPWSMVFANNTRDRLINHFTADNQTLFTINNVDFEKTEEKKNINNINTTALNMTIIFDHEIKEKDLLSNFINKNIFTHLDRYSSDDRHIIKGKENIIPKIKYSNGKTEASFKVYGIGRHPSQLYEAISTFLLFLLLAGLWMIKKDKIRTGTLFGLFLILLFPLRFVWEFLKENQSAFENEMTINMGQILSIPMILIGIYFLFFHKEKDKK